MRLTRVLPWVLALAACDDDAGAGDALAAADASPPDAALPDAPPPDAMVVDRDGDGLDDAWEHEIAQAYLPFLSLDPADGCPLGGIVYRLRPHPLAPALLLVTYDHLYQDDCGLGGHVGDNEVFGVTVDPARPPPAGILAIRAIPHQGTLCERATECGVCPGMPACETQQAGGVAWPVVYAALGKHGHYVFEAACDTTFCLDMCTRAATAAAVPLVNAGEPTPAGHLTDNLTTGGFITAANGWTALELMNFDPWDPMASFGDAGNVAGDLVDPAFETPACP